LSKFTFPSDIKNKIVGFVRKLSHEVRAYVEAVISALPGVSGVKLRAFYLRRTLASLGTLPAISSGIHVVGANAIHIGNNFFSGRGCSLYADGDGQIKIGSRVALNSNVCLNASIGGKIEIGNDVLVGPSVLMRTTDHLFFRTDIPIWQQGHRTGAISIEDDVWVGGNVSILGGVRIGRGAVIAAGAVVTRDIAAYSVVAGVPARFIKWRLNAPAVAGF
jgi:galactoside O-acetyltransferase